MTTDVRPNSFMQNITAHLAPSIRVQGTFYAATGQAKYRFLDVRDIAAVAANILASPGKHAGKIYELNGPEAVTYADLASRIHATFVDIPVEAQPQAMLDLGMPEWQVTALLDLQQYYVNGQGGEGDGVLETLLGRKPITLDQFLKEFESSFAMSLDQMKDFVRNHFEEFVNKKNLDIAYVNFAPEFVDHGSDVPPHLPAGPEGAKQYVGAALKKFPDIIAEANRVVVRNRWTGGGYEFSGIVIWQIANRQLVSPLGLLDPSPPHQVTINKEL